MHLHPHQSDFCILEVKLKFSTWYISTVTTFARDAYAMDSLTSPLYYISGLKSESCPAVCSLLGSWTLSSFLVELWFIGLSQSPRVLTGPRQLGQAEDHKLRDDDNSDTKF